MTIDRIRTSLGFLSSVAFTVVFMSLSSNTQIANATSKDALSLLTSIVIDDQVEYEEETQNAFFMHPQKSRGTLTFDVSTGTLIKTVREPDPAVLTVSADRISIVEGEVTRELDLFASPTTVSLFRAFRALLLADPVALEEYFTMKMQDQGATGWSILFTPRIQSLGENLESILLEVKRSQVQTILTRFTNGDWQRLTIIHPPADDVDRSNGSGD